VRTGLISRPEFAGRAAAGLAEATGLPLRSHPDKFADLSAHDELVFARAAPWCLGTVVPSWVSSNRLGIPSPAPELRIGEQRATEDG
jgi:fumarate hydratase class II